MDRGWKLHAKGSKMSNFSSHFPSSLHRICAYSFMKALLWHSIHWCGDKNKKVVQDASWEEKKRKPGCIILQDKCIPEEKWLFNVIKTLSQLAICIHILTCTLSGWCRDIQSIFTNQFRTVSATAATKENTHAIIYSSYSSGSRCLFAYSV